MSWPTFDWTILDVTAGTSVNVLRHDAKKTYNNIYAPHRTKYSNRLNIRKIDIRNSWALHHVMFVTIHLSIICLHQKSWIQVF